MEPSKSTRPARELSQRPIVDIMPPRPIEAPRTAPLENPSPQSGFESQTGPLENPNLLLPTQQPKPSSAQAKSASHNDLAVLATIIIVLGLAVLFVYAYLRTKNISFL